MEIIINNLSKNYGKRAALEKVSLTIPSGMYGLLGRNGAGKTSLMRILATLSVPSGGEISMNGIPIKETEKIREIVGYLPQDFSFYRNMSVYDAMDYLGLLSNIPDKIRKERISELLEQVNLKADMRTKIRALSGGMKKLRHAAASRGNLHTLVSHAHALSALRQCADAAAQQRGFSASGRADQQT